MGAKMDRLDAIRKIVSASRVSDQGELINALKQRGIHTTQATLSRDLRAMNIVKRTDADGLPRYTLPFSARAYFVPGGHDPSIISIEYSDSFAVIKTHPGYAGMVASRIDGAAIPGLMGTIAGDDTILVIMRKGSGSPVPLLEPVFQGISTKEI
ncbi:MAG: arginine repressor [Bacteroidales bacterium]|nr:arginine repressor [Bacteroidales bacterium]